MDGTSSLEVCSKALIGARRIAIAQLLAWVFVPGLIVDLRRFLYSSAEDQPSLAVASMLTGLLALSLQDAIGKLLSEHLTLWQFQAVRAVFNILFLLLLARWTMQGFSLRPKRFSFVFLRSLFHVAALMFFFGSSPFLTMAEMAGGLYTFPLFVVVLSVLILRERVGLLRVGALLVGFAGTLLIIQPGTDSFSLVSLMPVGAGLCYGMFVIITRKFCRDESPVVLTMVSNVSILGFGTLAIALVALIDPSEESRTALPNIMNAWSPMTLWMLALVIVCTVFNVIGNIGMSKAYQSAEASFLAPFDYSYLVFATFWGFVFWRDIPSSLTLLGMAMIAASGMFVAWREKQLAQKAQLQS